MASDRFTGTPVCRKMVPISVTRGDSVVKVYSTTEPTRTFCAEKLTERRLSLTSSSKIIFLFSLSTVFLPPSLLYVTILMPETLSRGSVAVL